MPDPTSGGLLGGIDPSLLLSLGAGLLSQRGQGSSLGAGLLGGMQAYQQNRAANQQNQMQQLDLQRQRALYGLQMGAIQKAQGQPPSAPPPMPSASVPIPGGLAAPNPYAPDPMAPSGGPAPPTPPPPAPSIFSPVPADQIAATQVPGGLQPDVARAFAYLDPKTANSQLDAYAKAQLAEQQRLHADALSKTAGLASGKIPISTLRAKGNEEVLGYFDQEARAQGLDLSKDADARQVAMILHNRLGGSIGAPDVQAVLPMQTVTQNGTEFQIQPETNKKDMVPQPRMYPTAAGYQPSAGAQGQLPASESPTLAANKAGAVASATAPVKNVSAVVQDFQKGATAKSLDGLNTAISHMGQLQTAASALGNGNVRVLNSFGNFFGRQFGSNSQTNFDIVKSFASGEVAKAVLPGGGGEAERQEISNAIANSSSPQQLSGAIQKWQELLAGKTDSLRQRWDSATKGTQGDFEQFLTPPTRAAVQAGEARNQSAQAPPGSPPPVPKPVQPLTTKGLGLGKSYQQNGWTVTRVQ